ncbi:hypothetical protein [Hymenobacter sp. B1770]|uniref:hypothetical protein n=1 Tax=Hymenobacter sp. B1770 TaxID=1718788 RepID=UPI003CF8D3A5
MVYRHARLYLTLIIATLASCNQYNTQYNIGVRSFYNLKTNSYKVAEAQIVQLYRDGTLETNSDSLTKLIARSIPGFPIDSAQNECTKHGYRKYQLGAVVKQDFVVFYPVSQTYYHYEITNCGGPSGCDVHVNFIIKKDPHTGKRVDVQWQDAGPSLQEFEDQLLPIILQKFQ